ncbi:hypothetical protein ACFVS2_26710 [Brevibacillus sp. NPDC058079]|uniref:hypothetical protein n=1 Tax=Brevibacillus sp. NPDC058079 TaxID=3346330 RepID=UPI0036EEE7DC
MEIPKWVEEHWEQQDNPDCLQEDFENGKHEDDLYQNYVVDGSDIDADYLNSNALNELFGSFSVFGPELMDILDKYGEEYLSKRNIAVEQLKLYYAVLFEREMDRLRSVQIN